MIKPENEDNVLLAVYGTLKSTHKNHSLLGTDAKVRAKNVRIPGYSIFNLGWFPGIVKDDNGSGVVVEIVEIPKTRVEHQIDGYEGVPSLYRREVVKLENGTEVQTYIYNRPIRGTDKLIPSGNWEDKDD